MRKSIMMTAFLLSSTLLQADNITLISRYATVKNEPSKAQLYPLEAVQIVHFPQSIQTVQEALQYWLRHSGYHLVSEDQQTQSLKQLLHQPLADVHRHLGPLSIREGLLVLVGKHLFRLTKNDLSRDINFSVIDRRKA